MEQGNSRQLFIHLIKDILKARGAKVEQQQVQEFLRVCREGVPVVFRAQDLDADTWRRIGGKSNSILTSMDLERSQLVLRVCGYLSRTVWICTLRGQKVFPPETVKSETKPSAPLEEPLDVDTFTELLDDDQFDLVEAEFEEEATGYSNEKFPPPQLQTECRGAET